MNHFIYRFIGLILETLMYFYSPSILNDMTEWFFFHSYPLVILLRYIRCYNVIPDRYQFKSDDFK